MVIKDLQLPWDYFLDVEIDKEVYRTPELRAAAMGHVRNHIDAFRGSYWPQIKHELANKPVVNFETQTPMVWTIPDDLEPHWVASGKAVFWQQDSIRRPERIRHEDGSVEVVVHWEDGKWHPTLPLRANSSSQVAYFLGKGLRLRPPGDGVSQEVYDEAALRFEGTVEEEVPPFFCNNHHQGSVRFRTWKAYTLHCQNKMELPEITQAPPEVLRRANKFPYYCFLHNRGFKIKQDARDHHRLETMRPGRALHPTLEEMELKKES
jgi:hypothetical protein